MRSIRRPSVREEGRTRLLATLISAFFLPVNADAGHSRKKVFHV
jgi:hypothetical protein